MLALFSTKAWSQDAVVPPAVEAEPSLSSESEPEEAEPVKPVAAETSAAEESTPVAPVTTVKEFGDETITHEFPKPAFTDLAKVEESIAVPMFEWEFNPEYRMRFIRIDPLELNGVDVRRTQWAEQRFRLDTTVKKPGIGAIRLQMDALDGVLFGDNGEFPETTSGVSLTSNRPNLKRWDVGLPAGADPLDRRAYRPVLVDADLLEINYLYADVYLPVGILRFGRQPKKYGAGIPSHDGGAYNRWGVSSHSDAADRLLFGTKLDQAFYVLMDGKDHVPDASPDNGIIFAMFYDWQVQDDIHVQDDDLSQFGGTLEFRKRNADWFGLKWKDLYLTQAMVHLSNKEFQTSILGFPGGLGGEVGNMKLAVHTMVIAGETREISEGFATLTGTQATTQKVQTYGLQTVLDYKTGPVTWTMQFDLASGDDDPRVTTPLTSFNYARDMNVGLLMFEHILAFETKRSAAVGVENLSGLDSRSFPLTEVESEGRFTNAVAVFPQAYVEIFKHPAALVHGRVGGLFAWTDSPGGLVDPIITSLSYDGVEISDDAVNFHGGKPARYYGAELDLQLGLTYKDVFYWTLEGAILFPGAAFHDRNGDAVRSYLVENRFEVRF